MRISTLSFLFSVALSVALCRPAPAQQPLPLNDMPPDGQALASARIIGLDPSLDRIVAPDEKVFVVRGSNEFGIIDGNVWVPDGTSGYLLFSDLVANVIYKWTPATQQLSVYLNNSGYTGSLDKISAGYIGRSGPLYIFAFGSNGIAIDPQGRIVFCAQGDKKVVRVEKDGTRTVLAGQYQGKSFNRPNKLAIKADGTIYFSDMRFPTCSDCEQPLPQALYMIKNGTISLAARRGHGVTLSPNQKSLYISTNRPETPGRPGGGIIMRYDIQPDDSLANPQVFIDMTGQNAPNGVRGGPDGFTVDREGNVYTGGPGGMWIINPGGKHIGTILLPEGATNVGFGDADMKTLYLLDRRNLLKIRLKVAGVSPRAPTP